MELFRASAQWATRPNDQRFASLSDLYRVTREYAMTSAERNDVPYSSLRTEAQGNEVVVVGKGGVPACFTHHAFGQLSNRVGAPAAYLRQLPATLAVQNLNHGLKARGDELGNCKILFHKNGSLVLRALTSGLYGRIWNYEIAERLLGLESRGWKVPPAMTDHEKPSGIYASDHDMFVFLVNDDRRVKDGSAEGLGRGIFVSNSEVGAASCRVTRFFYRYVCGNHIVWGASQVVDVAIRHVGESVHGRAFGALMATVTKYADSSVSDDEAGILKARTYQLGHDKKAVLDLIFGKGILSRTQATESFDAVKPEIDGDPLTAWGFVQGMTRYSQHKGFGDERTAIDSASAKVLALAF